MFGFICLFKPGDIAVYFNYFRLNSSISYYILIVHTLSILFDKVVLQLCEADIRFSHMSKFLFLIAITEEEEQ